MSIVFSQIDSVQSASNSDHVNRIVIDDSFPLPQQNIITGLVTNTSEQPLQGVTIKLKNDSKVSTSTDVNGRFVLNVPKNEIIQISLVGHITQEINVAEGKDLTIILEEDKTGIEEVVVVGFGTQKKESNVGSQATIKREELKVPVANLSTAIAGRLAGVVATQRGGGPVSTGADLFVRGVGTFASSPQGPLLVVDGVPDRDINNIDPEDVESFTVLKDATATAVYGTRGANGVIIITTRKGKAGKPQISAEVQGGLTQFTYLPKFVDAPTFMRLYNEGQTLRGKTPFYSEETIQKHVSGEDPDLYPNVSWYDVLFNDFGSNKRVNTNISGGADIAQYYLSIGYYTETGQFKTENIDSYNATLKRDRFNFTSNLDINVTPSTKLAFGVNGYLTNYNRPNAGDNYIFELASATPPHIIPPQYSNGQSPYLGGTNRNPYEAMTLSGIQNSYQNVVRSNIRLTQQLDMLTQGLSVSGMFAFDVNVDNNLHRWRDLPVYFAEGRDPDGNLITRITREGSENINFLFTRFSMRRIYLETSLNYSRTFGKHDVGGLLLFNQSDLSDGQDRVTTYIAAIPYRQRNVVGRGTYAYDTRYLLEANFSYSGSDNFDPDNRYGLFSSLGIGWNVSNERFFEGLKETINHFKLRYSYGTSGNASLQDPNNRFLYLSQFGVSGEYTFGSPGSTRSLSGYNETLIGSPVSWETSYRHNIGLEMNFFNNEVQLIAELFKEDRKGILLRDLQFPYISGYTNGNLPFRNIGETKNKGIDITLEYNKKFNNGFFMARGTFNYNANEIVRDNLPPFSYPYLDREGHRISQRFGYIATGLFKSDEEIANAAVQPGDVRVGDIRYKDLNGDGIINADDQTAIGYGDVPAILYGVTLGGGYKGFDFSMFFQGAGLVDLNYSAGYATTPFQNGPTLGNLYAVATDRWNPDNPDAASFYPRLSTGETVTTNYQSSSWWIKRSDYLRLKQAEIGYNFTDKGFLKKLAISRLRLYANGFNLFTISKWTHWDPEIGDGRGINYPNTRVYNMGIRLNFN
ncbi:SusC/RagA family TonB-linked outer membrane protein [Sphingobacterium paludis]|uniref:SusC/RagA family TonB-linked outer membrane protein n=1 Tax=Sphingobacterium paludis TaxID=1476465 RepID=UPI001AAF3AA8|nr:TonB-dependent receptor [Sphingobacterium paludis]